MTLTSTITVEAVQQCGTDRAIAESAWVSTAGGLNKSDADAAKLIPCLMRERHGVPFEAGMLQVRIHAPIFVMRQAVKHRAGVSFSEESGRYRVLSPVFYVPAPDRPMVATATHKAMRPDYEPADEAVHRYVADAMEEAYEAAWAAYRAMLAIGIAREMARAVLPVGLFSTAYVTFNPRSLMHFLSLRTKRDDAAVKSFPQHEINQVADQVEAIFAEHWPVTHAAFVASGRVAP